MITIKAPILAITIIAVTALASPASPRLDRCAASEVTVDSRVISGHAILFEGGRWRRADYADVDIFDLRGGEWASAGSIHFGPRGFAWLADGRAKIRLTVRLQGYESTTVYVNVRRLKGRPREIVIPLSTDGCGRARLEGRR